MAVLYGFWRQFVILETVFYILNGDLSIGIVKIPSKSVQWMHNALSQNEKKDQKKAKNKDSPTELSSGDDISDCSHKSLHSTCLERSNANIWKCGVASQTYDVADC
jgi:hypothetical protein